MTQAQPWVNILFEFENYDNNHFFPYVDPGQWLTQPVTQALSWATLKSSFKNTIITTFICILTKVNSQPNP
jgi:hypothetical protein